MTSTQVTVGSLRRIVVASDFSPGASRAVRRTRLLPLASGAEIILLHISPAGASDDMTAAAQVGLDRAADTLARALGRLRRADVAISTTRRSGRPAEEIARFTAERQADLIVVGRRGAGKVRSLLLGSTAEQVAHLSDTPVLVVEREPAAPFLTPVIALTSADDSIALLDAAVRLLPSPDCRLEIVSVAHVPLEGWLWGGWMSSKEILRIRKITRDQTQAALAAVAAACRDRGSRARVTVVEGDPRQAILKMTDRRRADLLVVGTQGGTGAVRFHIGSVAAHLIRHAGCDVLVARAGQAAAEGEAHTRP
jgi:nucleotide-binding universal stress UspA family protein